MERMPEMGPGGHGNGYGAVHAGGLLPDGAGGRRGGGKIRGADARPSGNSLHSVDAGGNFRPREPSRYEGLFTSDPDYPWYACCQGSLWRREALLSLLRKEESAWKFECFGSPEGEVFPHGVFDGGPLPVFPGGVPDHSLHFHGHHPRQNGTGRWRSCLNGTASPWIFPGGVFLIRRKSPLAPRESGMPPGTGRRGAAGWSSGP